MQRHLSFALMLLACSATIGATNAAAASSGLTQLAQAQTEPSPSAMPRCAPRQIPRRLTRPPRTRRTSRSAMSRPSPAPPPSPETDEATPLKVKDDIYLNDVMQTGANSSLGITFIDATTFNLKASAEGTSTITSMRTAARNAAILTSSRVPSPSRPPRSPRPAT